MQVILNAITTPRHHADVGNRTVNLICGSVYLAYIFEYGYYYLDLYKIFVKSL
jgi:hypothetical protein